MTRTPIRTAGLRRTSTMERSQTPVRVGALHGLLAAALGTGAAHLVAALVDPAASPVLAVGSTVIDATPTPVKEWAVSTFGTADKPILVGSVAVVTLLLAALAGVLHRTRPVLGLGLLAALTALAGAAALSRPAAGPAAVLPSVVAGVLGCATLAWLAARREADTWAAPGQPARRGVLAAGGAGVAAAALGGGGQVITARRRVPEIALPEPTTSPRPLPAGIEGTHEGVSPFVTPRDAFYRVDTALTVPRVDPKDWQLVIDGDVERPLTLSFDELLELPMIEKDITMTCVSNEVGGGYVGSARWLGVPTRTLLERVGVRPGADQVLSTSVEGMTISTPVQALMDDRDALVVVGMDGAPLPREHGFPVRLVTPGLYGFVGATKWLTKMTLTTYAAQSAYWTDRDWATDAPVLTQSRIDTPKPLDPIPAGSTVIGGVAWAQQRGIERVEVRIDDGEWQRATLGPDAGIDYWRQWYMPWKATSGRHDISVRATDETGYTQTTERATPFPKGATGLHTIAVVVT